VVKAKKFWNMKRANKTGEIYIYGDIVSYKWDDSDVTAKSFKDDLDALDDIDTLNIYINSAGGSVFQGQAIYSILKRHKAHKNVYIDGIAASIASVIAMAGDAIFMPKNAMVMIHRPWTIAIGNVDDMLAAAEALEKIGIAIKAIYMERFNQGEDKLQELLDAETWLTADECLEYGLCDEVTGEKQIAASLNSEVLSKYRNVPDFLKSAVGGDDLEERQRRAAIAEQSQKNIENLKKILGGL
jgi:ATP-dependent Clp protease protease subunit